MKQFVISQSFASGFALSLMAKNLRTAADLSAQLGLRTPLIQSMAALWEQASTELGKAADHTELYRFIAGQEEAGPKPLDASR